MTTTAAIYCRISQDRVGAGLGVERQEQDCRALAERIGSRVREVYCDNDLSAYSGKPRPGYERLLDDVRHGRVDAVLTWHTDRLHRSPIELEGWINAAQVHGVAVHTVKAGLIDLATSAGRMVARQLGAVAKYESEQKGERVAAQKRQAQAAGRWLGGRRPFGYLADAVAVHPTEGPALADAARRILVGDSVRSIAQEWNGRGLTTVTGAQWTGANLRQLLLRPRNAGLTGNVRNGRVHVVGEGQWAPVIEPDTWRALVALLTDESRRTHGGTSRRLLGSFLFYCECGERVMSGGNGANGQPRYRCPTMHLRRAAAPIDEFVLDTVARILAREGGRLITPAADAEPLRDRLTVLRSRADEIASLFGDPDGGMTAAQFRTANDRVQGEIRAVQEEIGRLSSGSVLVGVADADDPAAAFLGADVDRQRVVIDALATVTLVRTLPGRQAGGGYFRPESVRIEPRT